MSLTEFDKAIAGGLTTAIIALAARYGFQTNAQEATYLGVIVTGLVGYVVGHAVVYFKSNKIKV